LIDRTPSTVGHALAELERVGLVKRHWVSRSPTQPYHTYVKLPAGEDAL
jgi:predicted transcriptional regulator